MWLDSRLYHLCLLQHRIRSLSNNFLSHQTFSQWSNWKLLSPSLGGGWRVSCLNQRFQRTAIDAGDTWSQSWRERKECHCATGDRCECSMRFQCVNSCGPLPWRPRTIRPTKSSLLLELWSQTVMTIDVLSSCCVVTLKLTDSLKTGSMVFLLLDVFFVFKGFSKCTKVTLM